MTFSPSPYQLAIREHFAHDPRHLVIEALAGSGKTTVLLDGIKHLPQARSVVVTSFARSIVEELQMRAAREGLSSQASFIRTMHGIGLRTLSRALKLRNQEVEKYKAERHINASLIAARILPPDAERTRDEVDSARALIAEIAHAVSWAKGMLASTPEQATEALEATGVVIPRVTSEEVGALVLDMLTRCATDVGAFDFDDMIWLPLVRGLPIEKFDEVLVDEAQDLNYMQIVFAQQLLAQGGRFTAVGDKFQSLYAFRGADTAALARIVAHYNAVTRTLPVTYRCPTTVVEEAHAYVPALEPAPGAAAGEVDEMEYDDFLDEVGPGDFVISRGNAALARTHHDLGRGRAIQLGRGAGDRLIALVRRARARSIRELEGWLNKHVAESKTALKTTRAQEDLADRVDSIRAFARECSSVPELLEALKAAHQDKVNTTKVILATTHAAKGKEANTVYIFKESYFRYDDDLQTEKNCMYVALTRAKRRLVYVHGHPLYNRKSKED